MKLSKIGLMMAAGLLCAGLFAADTESDAPARPRKAKFSMKKQLTEEERAAVTSAENELRTAIQNAVNNSAEVQKAAKAVYDAQLKAYKDAAARLTDPQEQEKADRIISKMEDNPEKVIKTAIKQNMRPKKAAKRARPVRRRKSAEN